jgi:hypothetical protein
VAKGDPVDWTTPKASTAEMRSPTSPEKAREVAEQMLEALSARERWPVNIHDTPESHQAIEDSDEALRRALPFVEAIAAEPVECPECGSYEGHHEEDCGEGERQYEALIDTSEAPPTDHAGLVERRVDFAEAIRVLENAPREVSFAVSYALPPATMLVSMDLAEAIRRATFPARAALHPQPKETK